MDELKYMALGLTVLPTLLLAFMGGTKQKGKTARKGRSNVGKAAPSTRTAKKQYYVTKSGKRYLKGSDSYKLLMKRLNALAKARKKKK